MSCLLFILLIIYSHNFHFIYKHTSKMLELSNYSPPTLFVTDCIYSSINNFYLTHDYQCIMGALLPRYYPMGAKNLDEI